MSTITELGAAFTTKITEHNLLALQTTYFKAMADCGYSRILEDDIFYWGKSFKDEGKIRCPFNMGSIPVVEDL